MYRHVALVTSDGGGMAEWPNFDLVPDDWEKLTSALAATTTPTRAVIECAFDEAR